MLNISVEVWSQAAQNMIPAGYIGTTVLPNRNFTMSSACAPSSTNSKPQKTVYTERLALTLLYLSVIAGGNLSGGVFEVRSSLINNYSNLVLTVQNYSLWMTLEILK